MKERYNIEIAGITFSIVSDDDEEFVRETVSAIDGRVRGILSQSRNCSKLDAVALCALDYCGEKLKADRRIKNLEAQIEILEANMHRLREEAASCREAAANANVPADNEEDHTLEAESADSAAEAGVSEADENEDSRGQKLRQIEALLGGQLKLEPDED